MYLNFDTILKEGCTISSSGTTGPPKDIYRDPDNLKVCNAVSIDVQEITKDSRIYTVCKLDHAGGLLAQTLPAYSIGADVTIEKFSPYEFIRQIRNYTHTHITPDHGKAILLMKNFQDLDLTDIWVTSGSDKVPWNFIEKFVDRGATFMTNWGMSEIGPCAINTVFRTREMVSDYKSRAIPQATLLGDKKHCNVRVADDNELMVSGDISIYKDEWFATGDYVAVNSNGEYYYYGRDKADVNKSI